jgi:hypothetical protein
MKMEKTKKENNEKHVRNCNVEDEDKNIQEMIHKKLMKITKTVKGMGYDVTFDGDTIVGEEFHIFNKHGKYFIEFSYDLDPVLAGMLSAKLVKKYNVEVDWDYFYVNDDRSCVYHGDTECEEAYLKDIKKRILKEMLKGK